MRLLAVGVRPYRSSPMAAFDYRSELRRGDETVATGHLSVEEPLAVGDPLAIGNLEGIVRAVEPLLGERESRLVVQLKRPSTEEG